MNKLKLASWIYLIGSVIVLSLKFGAYALTNSNSILSDALESWVNVAAAILGIFVIKFVSQPADENHPYGHGKLEYFSAAIEGALIAFAALLILIKSTESLLDQTPLNFLDRGLILILGASALNAGLAIYLKKQGTQLKSPALTASSQHLFADVWTSLAVVLGLGVVYLTKVLWLDAVIALALSCKLLWDGYGIIRRSLSGLLDEVDPDEIKSFLKAFAEVRSSDFIDIHQLRMIRAGREHHVDAHLVVPEYWSVAQSHVAMESLEEKIAQRYPVGLEIAFHLDPCAKSYCANCAVQGCPIRQESFKEAKNLTFESATGRPLVSR